MNREDIIRMAQEAGGFLGEVPRGDAWMFTEEGHLERFAAFVASAEREACAKQLDALGCDHCATAIRASGNVATNDTSQERVDETSKNVQKPCGLECDCTDVCKQVDYKALWQQMCERCDELDKRLSQSEQAPMNYYRADAKGNLERTDIHFAQPEQKPVAWANLNALSEQINSVNCGTIYGLPSEAEGRVPLYTTPPQRTWVGLTDEEIKLQWSEFWETECHPWAIDFAKAIEAKLRSKNNDT